MYMKRIDALCVACWKPAVYGLWRTPENLYSFSWQLLRGKINKSIERACGKRYPRPPLSTRESKHTSCSRWHCRVHATEQWAGQRVVTGVGRVSSNTGLKVHPKMNGASVRTPPQQTRPSKMRQPGPQGRKRLSRAGWKARQQAQGQQKGRQSRVRSKWTRSNLRL